MNYTVTFQVDPKTYLDFQDYLKAHNIHQTDAIIQFIKDGIKDQK